MLPRIKQYFPINFDKERHKSYAAFLDAYSGVYEKINEKNEAFIEEVKHDWEPLIVGERLEETFNFINDDLHPKIYTAFRAISDSIQDNYNRKEAIKIGKKAHQDLEPLINQLEKSINKNLSLLKEAL